MTYKTAMTLFTTLVFMIGCGSTAPAPTIPNVSGVWSGTLTSTPTSTDPNVHTSQIVINVQQGKTGTTSQGAGFADLTMTTTIKSPDCPAVASGSGTGTVIGSRVLFSFNLSDGGQLGIVGTDNMDKIADGAYAFNSGTCAPQSGASPLNKN